MTETNTDVVINLSKCKNITLSGLILGHDISPKDQCMAGVVQMSNSENIIIDNCDLFGCGLLGISTYNSSLIVTNSTIRDCSKSILEISRGSATFKNCIFSNNGHGFISEDENVTSGIVFPSEYGIALTSGKISEPVSLQISDSTFIDNGNSTLLKVNQYVSRDEERGKVTYAFDNCTFSGNDWGDEIPSNTSDTPVAPTTPVTSFAGFVDVNANAYYAAPVAWAVEKGITAGTSATTFGPDSTCSQAQILTFLWRAYGSPEAAGTVSGSEYYALPFRWAQEQGVISHSLAPDSPCTRADVVTYLWKLAGSPEAQAAAFTDVSANASYAKAVNWAVEKGITAGVSKDRFGPDSTCTRSQIVTFLYAALGK
ncbi:hypothetical protein D1646_12315 [Pseudoflavonifractor sp. 60]|nr:hypothetical protein [Pseudoflavonifractor sp. 60]